MVRLCCRSWLWLRRVYLRRLKIDRPVAANKGQGQVKLQRDRHGEERASEGGKSQTVRITKLVAVDSCLRWKVVSK